MIFDGHTLPCLHTDGYCKPTTQTPYILLWFNEEFCLIFRLQQFVGRMTKLKNRYWLETDTFNFYKNTIHSRFTINRWNFNNKTPIH